MQNGVIDGFPIKNPEQIKMPIEFYGSMKHYIEHLVPIYNALKVRGPFYVPPTLIKFAKMKGIKNPIQGDPPPVSKAPVAVASIIDLCKSYRFPRPVIFTDHGVGFSYRLGSSCCPGGSGPRHRVNLFLSSNNHSARRDIIKNPETAVAVSGCSRMDRWHEQKDKLNEKLKTKAPIIVMSTHWDCKISPYSRSAFYHMEGAVPMLREKYGKRFFLSAHIKIQIMIREKARYYGVPFLSDFNTVLRKASLYIMDQGSTLYEFASMDRPVVAYNCPYYDKRFDGDFGMRFWEHCPGIQCDEAINMLDVVEEALSDPIHYREMRERAVSYIYAYTDGKCAERAAKAITEWQKAAIIPYTPQSDRTGYVSCAED